MASKREIQGAVVKVVDEKAASILIEREVVHPRYRRIVKCFRKYLIHDERDEVRVGGTIVAVKCKPFSKGKSFRLRSVLATGVE